MSADLALSNRGTSEYAGHWVVVAGELHADGHFARPTARIAGITGRRALLTLVPARAQASSGVFDRGTRNHPPADGA